MINIFDLLKTTVATSLLIGGLVATTTAHSKDITLGLSAPTTGNQAQYGIDIRAGAELAIAKLNSSNFISDVNFTLKVEDSKGDPKEAANVAQKFASDGSVFAVVGDFSSTACLAAAPIYQRAKIIMMTPTASHPAVTQTGSYIFRNTPIASSEAGAVTDWAVKELGFKRVGIIGRNDDYGRAYGKIFASQVEALGAEVVGTEYFNPSDPDLKPLITGMRAKKPDVVLLAMFQVEAALLFQQSKEMNFSPTFMSGAGLFNPQLIDLAGDAANGMLLVSTYHPDTKSAEVADFVQAFKAKNGGVPSKFSAHAYAGVMLIANAIKTSGSTDSDKVRTALAASNGFPSVIGNVTFDDRREVILDLMKIQIKDKQFVPYSK